MKNILTISIILILATKISAQDYNQIITDPTIKKEILYGYCTREALESEPFSEWFYPEYKNYTVDEARLAELDQEMLQQCLITIVLGTWCSDSKREVPRFFKIVDHLGLDETAISLICVDRRKNAEGTEVNELIIDFVPTFIFYIDNVEVGRIVEAPEASLEEDWIEILNQVP